MNKKIDILKQILLISTGEYYEINLTQDLVPGLMYQVVDDKKYNINEKLGLTENARFSDVIAAWGKHVPKEERQAFFDFFDLSNLIFKYEQGQDHLMYRYWTKTVLLKPMLAEQHIFMYRDEEIDELCAFTYVVDLTETVQNEEYTNKLKENQEALAIRLEENAEKRAAERKYLEVLCRNYILAYSLNVNEQTAEVLALDQRAHVWKMAGMWQGAKFDYDAHLQLFSEQFIVTGQRTFTAMLSRDYIARRMKKTTRFSFRMECVPNAGGNQFYEVQVVRLNPNAFDGRVIIVSEEIDDMVHAESRHRAELNTERKYLEVLTEDFVAVYHVNLKENASALIKVDTNVDGYDVSKVSLRKRYDYKQKVELYCERFVAPEQREKFRFSMEPSNILRELQSTPRFVYRYKITQRNGKQKYFEVQILRMGDNVESGDVLIAFRDVDDVVTMEEQHHVETEERLAREINQNEVLTAIGNSFYTLFDLDLEKDTYENLQLKDEVKHFYINAKSASVELNNLCANFIAPEYRETMRKFVDLTTLPDRMKDQDAIETECVTIDGEWWLVRFIEKRRDENGKVSHVLYVARRISDEKKLEERLISIAEAAKAANEAKTEFVSKVAHDIRTPMNSLFGFLQIAEANVEDAEKVKYSLQKIRVAGEFLKELVNDVLDISKMENGKLSLKPKEISVSKLFEELPTSMQGSDFGKEIEFNYTMRQIHCDKVMGDALRLKQIYTNILSNAVKYTPNGGKVDFEVIEEAGTGEDTVLLVVRVADNGIGMSKEFMGKCLRSLNVKRIPD